MIARTTAWLAASLLLVCAGAASAQTSRLRLTGGVPSVDGAAGGGLTPWALVGSLATAGERGATAFATTLRTPELRLSVAGASLAFDERWELSLAAQELGLGRTLSALGLPGLRLRQTIAGLKWRLAGDTVLDADRPWPQLAAGLLVKRADAGALSPTLAGPLGSDRSGAELYLAATRLWLAQGLLANLTLRATRANQNGLLGHGSATDRRVHLRPEASLVWLAGRSIAIGVEARAKPDALRRSSLGDGALAEDAWFDVFAAWAPSKAVSFTLAGVDLGRVAPGLQPRRQRGVLASIQLTF